MSSWVTSTTAAALRPPSTLTASSARAMSVTLISLDSFTSLAAARCLIIYHNFLLINTFLFRGAGNYNYGRRRKCGSSFD